MPFPYQSSAAPVRTRRPKDRTTTTIISGRKTKDISRSSTRTPPQSLRPAQPSLYAQQNLTLDQLPALPGSGNVSPTPSSPLLRVTTASSIAEEPTTSLISSIHLHTPAALRPYLDHDDEDDDNEHGNDHENENENECNDLNIPNGRQSPKPKETSSVKSASPKLVNQTSESLISIPHSTPSPKSVETALYRSPTPPPPAPSPIWSQPPPAPSPIWNQPPPAPSSVWSQPPPAASTFEPNPPYSQPLPYLSSPPPFAPAIPYFSGPPKDQYYPPPYGGPSFLSMAQTTSNHVDHQSMPPPAASYYATFAPPQHVQAPYHAPMRSSSHRARSSTSSRRSFSGEPFPSVPPPPPNGSSPEQAIHTNSPISNGQEKEDESGNLLQRIQSALPDLHLLLNRYQETSGQLEVGKSMIRETEAQKVAALKQKEIYIERLGKELETVSNKHSAESSKLRLEIGNMEEKHRELQESLAAEKKAKHELEKTTQALRREKEDSERRLVEEKSIMALDIKHWRENESKDSAAKQHTLEMELQRQKQESEAKLQARVAELNQRYASEKEELQAGWSRQQRELEDSHTRQRRDFDLTLETRQKTIEEGHRKQLEDKDVWNKERDAWKKERDAWNRERDAWNKERKALTHSWSEERALLGKDSGEQRTILGAQHQNEKDEMLRKWQASQSRANKLAEENTLKLQKEIEKVRAGWDADKARFSKAIGELNRATLKLNDENGKLQKLAEAFGEVTDLKSREDPFYNDAFHHLYKQISDLTLEHFRESVDSVPAEVAKAIPPTIPPFFSNTESSIQLRAAYVEHMIAKIICRRIFQPFLFTISLRHGSPDLLFQSMSDHLRKKSTRREALWRQRTLHAAYTVSSAKQSINKIAAIIVDEVVDAIRYFTNQTRWEQVTVAVRRIVKTAAETWRYARLEVAMITASMTTDDRPEFQRLSNPVGPISALGEALDQQRQLLLSLFPIIEREAIHEDIRDDSERYDRGYIYFAGRMLYSDDPIITRRLEEIQRTEEQLRNHVIDEEAALKAETKTCLPASGGELEISTGSSPRSPSLGTRTRSDSQLGGPPPVFLPNGCEWDEIDTGLNPSCKRQLQRDGRRKLSGGSRSQVSPVSHSSERSTSSDARSSSTTTRAAALPSWGGLGGDVIRGQARW